MGFPLVKVCLVSHKDTSKMRNHPGVSLSKLTNCIWNAHIDMQLSVQPDYCVHKLHIQIMS